MNSKFEPKGSVYTNKNAEFLIQKALKRKEGILSKNGVFVVKTGKYTGRSPFDRYIVDTKSLHNDINWGKVNIPITEDAFNALYKKILSHLNSQQELFVFEGAAGADREYAVPTKVVSENAYHALFASYMLREGKNSSDKQLVVYHAPSITANPGVHETNSEAFIILHLVKKVIIIGGTSYAGEIKKSIFSFLNYFFPRQKILPMHCSANVGKSGDTALFFGLSGTGKTTLSADSERLLIGDDEHGWSKNGIFNIEGGCYAKCINLSKENEPQIYNAIRDGAIAENVVLTDLGEFDFDDARYTQNTRSSYPLHHILNSHPNGIAGHPKNIIFLTADAFGVLPPVARLTDSQTLYHFASGYTSKLAGTERGIKEPVATFSMFFGEPFMPAKPKEYIKLLRSYLNKYKPDVYLVNTGWTGGTYGVGKRISLKATRTIIHAILSGQLSNCKYRHDKIFNLSIPVEIQGFKNDLLDPKKIWNNKQMYTQKAIELAALFWENFKRFPDLARKVKQSGPQPQ